MNRNAVHQLENFFGAYFNTLTTVRTFFHINLDGSHRSGLLPEFRRIIGSKIDYAALPNPFIFLKHTLKLLTRIKFRTEQIYQQINRSTARIIPPSAADIRKCSLRNLHSMTDILLRSVKRSKIGGCKQRACFRVRQDLFFQTDPALRSRSYRLCSFFRASCFPMLLLS